VAGDEVIYDLKVDAVEEDSNLGFLLGHFLPPNITVRCNFTDTLLLFKRFLTGILLHLREINQDAHRY
jgi:hypothetical protein